MKNFAPFLFFSAASLSVAAAAVGQIAQPTARIPAHIALIAQTRPAPVWGGPIMEQDFNDLHPWPQLSALPASGKVKVSVACAAIGTVDTAKSTTASGAMLLTASDGAAGNKGEWSAGLTSGALPVRTTETNLGKLTL